MIIPVMGGGEAFTRLREIKPDIPIVISTGFFKEGDLDPLKEQRINGFLNRPFRKSELASCLSEALGNRG